MSILISYDVSDKHTEVKSEMLRIGFRDFWFDDKNQKNILPNTTLLGEGTPENAIKALHSAVDTVNTKILIISKITINSAVAVSWNEGCGVDNKPKLFKLLKRK
jgi:hypothetical protein